MTLRTILRCDPDNVFAAVECLFRPELRDQAAAVRDADLETMDGFFQLDLFERDAAERESLERMVEGKKIYLFCDEGRWFVET